MLRRLCKASPYSYNVLCMFVTHSFIKQSGARMQFCYRALYICHSSKIIARGRLTHKWHFFAFYHFEQHHLKRIHIGEICNVFWHICLHSRCCGLHYYHSLLVINKMTRGLSHVSHIKILFEITQIMRFKHWAPFVELLLGVCV